MKAVCHIVTNGLEITRTIDDNAKVGTLHLACAIAQTIEAYEGVFPEEAGCSLKRTVVELLTKDK